MEGVKQILYHQKAKLVDGRADHLDKENRSIISNEHFQNQPNQAFAK